VVPSKERATGTNGRGALDVSVSVAVALLAAAALAAPASARTFDRTVSCPVPVLGGVNVFALAAGKTFVSLDLPATLGQPKQLADAYAGHSAEVDLAWCKPAPKVPLARASLPLLGSGSLDDRCWSGATIVVRLRAQLDSHGSVTVAQIAVRSGKKLRPLVFVDWTAKHVAVYGTDDCMPGP